MLRARGDLTKLPDAIAPTLWEKLGLWGLPSYLGRMKESLMKEMVNSESIGSKTKATGVVGAIATMIAGFVFSRWEIVLDPGEVAVVLGAIMTVVMTGASWLKRMSANDVATARHKDGTVVQPVATKGEKALGLVAPQHLVSKAQPARRS